MELYSVLITGANRGIGLEFTRQLVKFKKPIKHIFVTYRNESTAQELKAIQNSASHETKVHLIKMDVSVPSEVEAAGELIEDVVGDNGLTLLINNAGVGEDLPYPEVTYENLLRHFNANTIGPTLLAQAMLPLLKKASSRSKVPGMSFSKAAILNISSVLGSISNVGIFKASDLVCPAYRMSKAALNMGMKILATVINDDNILVVNMCPGWVKTDMGTEQAEILPQDSVTAMLETISKLNKIHHGTYMDRFGKPYGW